MKKKFLSILCCFSVLLAGTQLQEVYASENLNAEQLDLEMIDVMDIADIGKNAMDNALIQAYTNKIQNMTASEFTYTAFCTFQILLCFLQVSTFKSFLRLLYAIIKHFKNNHYKFAFVCL